MSETVEAKVEESVTPAAEGQSVEDGVKQVFLRLPIPEYPHPLTISVPLEPELRLHLAKQPPDQIKPMMTTMLMNMLEGALGTLGLVIGQPAPPKEEKSSLIIPG